MSYRYFFFPIPSPGYYNNVLYDNRHSVHSSGLNESV